MPFKILIYLMDIEFDFIFHDVEGSAAEQVRKYFPYRGVITEAGIFGGSVPGGYREMRIMPGT